VTIDPDTSSTADTGPPRAVLIVAVALGVLAIGAILVTVLVLVGIQPRIEEYR